MVKIQEKWRESLIDINALKLENVVIDKIISYPPAGNDVFECLGKYNGKDINFIIKSERGSFADFDNEIRVLKVVDKYLSVPKVIESGKYNGHTYIVLSKIEGEKLSDIFRKNKNIDKNKYLYIYGQTLAKIHKLDIDWKKAKMRRINDCPKRDIYNSLGNWEESIINYLEENKPKDINYDTFIHGDFHYGNILWDNYEITGILDFEYSGLGFKEQDIAWSLILRPGQEFMDNVSDREMFLKGYKTISDYNEENLKWCLINGTMHFYLMNKEKEKKEYLGKLKKIINNLIEN